MKALKIVGIWVAWLVLLVAGNVGLFRIVDDATLAALCGMLFGIGLGTAAISLTEDVIHGK